MIIRPDLIKGYAGPSTRSGRKSGLEFLAKANAQLNNQRKADDLRRKIEAAQAEANRYAEEAKRASSFRGMASNFVKAVPQATADVLVGTPLKLGATAYELKDTFRGRPSSQHEYKVPGFSPFKSFQSDIENAGVDYYTGEKTAGDKAKLGWEIAKLPLAVLETAGIGKGIGMGVKAYKAAPTALQGLRKAAPEVVDAFVPTTRGLSQRQTTSKLSKKLDNSIEAIRQEKKAFQKQKEAMRQGLSFYDDQIDDQYKSFKNLYNRFGKGKNREAFESMDVQRIKNTLGEKVDPNVIDNILYSQTKKDDEMLDSFLSMMEKERKYKEFKFTPSQVKFKGEKGTKSRGLIETISKSPEYSAEMAENLKGAGGYDVSRQMPIVKESQRTIAKNISEAERIATGEISDRATIMSDELLKHYDSIAQNAKNSGDMQTFEAAMKKSRDLAFQIDINLRESGRAISAANRFNKQSPAGMLRTLQEIAEQKGTKLNLSNEQVFNFQRKAEEISQIIDPRERAFKTFDLMDEVYESVPAGMKDRLYEVLNLPRALMATADLSAPLRQGIFVATRNPSTFAKNFGKMFKYAFSENAYRNAQVDIVTSPNYNLYVKNKLPLTEIHSGLNTREEAFMSNLAEKIPIFGRIAKGSNRAYTGFLNKMRTDLFDDFIKTAEKNGIKDEKFLQDAARFVGAATGRGDIHKLFGGNQSGKFLSNFFFSPRLIASRVSLLNPKYYVDLHPQVRKEALKSLSAFVGTGMGVLGVAKLAGAEVGDDPRSADFGKIKVGNTRYDIWGGFQQYARLLGQLFTGEKISTTTGKETQLGQGFASPTRESITIDFFKSKLSPVASFLSRSAQGEQFGEPFRPGPELLDRFIPLVIQDTFDIYKERGLAGVAMETPAFFGVGMNTYGDQVPVMDTTDSGRPTVSWRQEPSLGESIYNKVSGTELTTIPTEMRGQLLDERKKENLREIEVNAAKARVLETGKAEKIGDTHVYMEDGIVKTKKIGKDSRTPIKDKLIYEEIAKRKTGNPFFTR